MKLKSWHVVAVISGILWLAYYPALSAPLNSVDDARLAHDLLNRPSFSWQDFWFPRSKSYFRPLINSSFILDQIVWGFEESFLHLENILIHWCNTLLVYFLARKIAGYQGLDTLAVPAVAAVLFGFHPINSEAVVWIAGRADLLATTFVLLCLLSMVQYFDRGNKLWIFAVAVAYFAGALAKETALLVLPGFLAFGWVACRSCLPPPGDSCRFKAWLPAFAAIFSLPVYVLLRQQALRGDDLGMRHVAQVVTASEAPVKAVQQVASVSASWLETMHVLLKGAGFYCWKLFQPFPLNFGIIEVPDGFFWLGCLLVPLALLFVARLSWASGFALLAMCLASVALLVSLGNISWTPYAERYMYAPSAMLALGIGLGGGKVITRWRRGESQPWLTCFLGVLMLLSSLVISQRALVWQDNLTLFADTVEKSPGFALAQNQLAEALWKQGRKEEALALISRIDMPESQAASLNKVAVLVDEGKLAEARQYLLEQLSRPETQAYHRIILERLIVIVERLRETDLSAEQAMQYDNELIAFLEQLWRRTGDPFYLYRLGQKQMEKGDFVKASEIFSLAYSKFPAESIYKEPSRKLAESLLEK